jgi:hypothetical protein
VRLNDLIQPEDAVDYRRDDPLLELPNDPVLCPTAQRWIIDNFPQRLTPHRKRLFHARDQGIRRRPVVKPAVKENLTA